MAKQAKSGNGIPNWKQKVAVIKALVGAYTYREIFEKVAGTQVGNSTPKYDIDTISEASRKWIGSKPKSANYTVYFDQLVIRLNCKTGTTGLAILNSSIDMFIEMLPEESRTLAQEAAGLPAGTAHQSGNISGRQILSPDRIIYIRHRDEFHSIGSGVRSGIIDTRNYYSTADAAHTWADLVSAEQYPTYDHCKAGLSLLFSHTDWKIALSLNPPTTAMMLAGGGAPTKDLVLLQSLLDQPEISSRPVTMLLVDANFYMLAQSQLFLSRSIGSLNGHSRVTMKYICSDVLQLRESVADLSPIFHRASPVVFTITGGTIGNISERRFFQSLDEIALDGDILVISADTVDDIPSGLLESDMKEKYGHDNMLRFISPGVVAVINEYQLFEPLDVVLKRVVVQVRSGTDVRLSDVPDSHTVTLSLVVKDRNITLLNSTRYRTNSLTDFARTFGWHMMCQVSSPLNKHFKQFAFLRK